MLGQLAHIYCSGVHFAEACCACPLAGLLAACLPGSLPYASLRQSQMTGCLIGKQLIIAPCSWLAADRPLLAPIMCTAGGHPARPPRRAPDRGHL